MSDFVVELKHLINSHSMENDSDTPDFILARYIQNCLDTYAVAIRQRDDYYKPKNKGGNDERISTENAAARNTALPYPPAEKCMYDGEFDTTGCSCDICAHGLESYCCSAADASRAKKHPRVPRRA